MCRVSQKGACKASGGHGMERVTSSRRARGPPLLYVIDSSDERPCSDSEVSLARALHPRWSAPTAKTVVISHFPLMSTPAHVCFGCNATDLKCDGFVMSTSDAGIRPNMIQVRHPLSGRN